MLKLSQKSHFIFSQTHIFENTLLPYLSIIFTRNMAGAADKDAWKNAKSIYDFTAKNIKGEDVSLEQYKDHVCVIVNTASKCGFTKQFGPLQELYNEYGESKGLRILGFPCNQFASQDPGDSDSIASFCQKNYGVTFDMFDKVDVNGSNAHPLWNYLKNEQKGTIGNFIKWNFTKFIIDKEGKPVGRHSPNTDPSKMKSDLEKLF